MNLSEEFSLIQGFLASHLPMINQEVLHLYPSDPSIIYPEKWLDELIALNDDDLYHVDGLRSGDRLSKGVLAEWIEEIHRLEEIEKILVPLLPRLPDRAYFKMKGKKQHEIDVLRSFISQYSFRGLLDIGGGVGHLGRTLAHYHGLEVTCVEADSNFIKIGEAREARYPLPIDGKPLRFVQRFFGEDFKEDKLLLRNGQLALGLHTCGPLSLRVFDTVTLGPSEGILNFGCCYGKLCPTSEINLNREAKKNPLLLSSFALNLAARGHADISREEWELKRRVKLYRCALHHFLMNDYQLNIETVGDESPKTYALSFSEFSKIKLKRLGLEMKRSLKSLEELYQEFMPQNNRLFAANVLRWQLGRVIEKYILIDRVLYLQENDLDVTFGTFFEAKLSPRNVGILALKRPPKRP